MKNGRTGKEAATGRCRRKRPQELLIMTSKKKKMKQSFELLCGEGSVVRTDMKGAQVSLNGIMMLVWMRKLIGGGLRFCILF